MHITKMKLEDLNPAKYNPRVDLTPGDEQYENIKNSVKQFGYIDPIIVNIKNDSNIIVGGHQRYKVLKDLGYDEIDVVQVDMEEDEEKACNITLNQATGDWDFDKLRELLEELKNTNFKMEDYGFEKLEKELKETKQEEEQEKYTKKIDIPHYEIHGDKPEISELTNDGKLKELVEEINNSTVSDDKKEFLRAAAYRHLVFDYSKIAEYYAHQDKEMQELMEKSALVIIDFDDAIKNGYVKLSSEIEKIVGDNYDE